MLAADGAISVLALMRLELLVINVACNTTILRLPCPGGHRPWAFRWIAEESSDYLFGYFEDNMLRLYGAPRISAANRLGRFIFSTL